MNGNMYEYLGIIAKLRMLSEPKLRRRVSPHFDILTAIAHFLVATGGILSRRSTPCFKGDTAV